jgi:hypothetical protein
MRRRWRGALLPFLATTSCRGIHISSLGKQSEGRRDDSAPHLQERRTLVVRTKDISMFEIFRGNIQVNSRGR